NFRKSGRREATLPAQRLPRPVRCASKSGRGCRQRRDAAKPLARTRSGEWIRSVETRVVAFNHKNQDCANRNFIPEAEIFPRSGITAFFAWSSRSEQKGQL